jgi:hypothetical protein
VSARAASDVDVGAVLLIAAGKQLGPRTRIDDRITDGTLERTMDGASTLTLTLDDADRTLLRSGLLDRQIDLALLGQWWRLVQVSKQADTLTLTFEDRVVAYLRQIKTPRKAGRSKMTRAEFALSIVREVKAGGGIPFFCPDLHVTQKVAIETAASTAPSKTGTTAQGISPGAALTVKGAAATSLQRQNAERVLDVAGSLNAGERATMALMQAVIVESQVQNLNYGDRDSLGILQVRSSTAGPMGIDNRDVEQCCNAFLTRGFWGKGGAITIAAKNPSMSTGQVAQNTQGSGVPGAYDQWRAEAAKWVAAYGGATGSGLGSVSSTRALPYQFQRGGTDGAGEDSWACLQRLAQEVEWRCFVADGAVWFASETTLIKAKPLAALSEETLGVDTIDFDVDNGKANSEANVDARAARLGFPPGTVVELTDCGPADGRWLVRSVTRGVFDAHATLTLKRPTQPLPEPAAETTTVTTGDGSSSGGAVIPGAMATASGTPEQIIDTCVVPLAQKHGMVTGTSPGAIAAANARHGPTVSGSRSDHQGPPSVAWASDMSNGSSPTPQMDALAKDLSTTFGIPWTGAGLVSATKGGYRYQLIYRTTEGGDHYNHVHFGCRKV